jgi:hypothetical protein
VDIIKLLENDPFHGPTAAAKLLAHNTKWDKYRHQKHDLFLSRNDTRDYFLTDVSNQPSRLLKNVAASAEAAEAAGSSGGGGSGSGAGGGSMPGGVLVSLDSSGRGMFNHLHHSDTMSSEPPPAPDFIPAPTVGRIGNFQAPAPVERQDWFYGNPPAAAPAARPPAPAPAPAPAPVAAATPLIPLGGTPLIPLGGTPLIPLGGTPMTGPRPGRGPVMAAAAADPFAGLLGSPSSARPALSPSLGPRGPAAAAAPFDPFAGLGGSPTPAAVAPRPVAQQPPRPAKPPVDDPFGDLL